MSRPNTAVLAVEPGRPSPPSACASGFWAAGVLVGPVWLGYPTTMRASAAVVGLPFALPIAVLALAAGLLSSGCQDPCVVLAERICNCERTFNERRACTTDRITNQQGRVEIDDADRELCSQKLDTCTCAALDQNDLAACGFVPEEDAP